MPTIFSDDPDFNILYHFNNNISNKKRHPWQRFETLNSSTNHIKYQEVKVFKDNLISFNAEHIP